MSRIYTVLLPDIGEGVVEGEVIEWLKEVGDRLEQDEPVVVVMTDKATVELPAPHPGTLAKQYHEPGQIAIKDRPLYDIALDKDYEAVGLESEEDSKKESEEEAADELVALASSNSATAVMPKARVPMQRAAGTKALATPPVRHLAQQLGINLDSVAGSGPEGRVLKEDLQALARGQEGTTAAGPETSRAAPRVLKSSPIWDLEGDVRTPMIGVRKYIAEKMVEAKYLIPNFAYFDQADMTRLMGLRKNLKQRAQEEGIRLTFMPFFIRVLSLCLKEFPAFNSSYDPFTNELVTHKQHNIGIAIKTDRGVIVPVLKGVQDMNLTEVVYAYEELKNRALAEKLSSSDMKESTITLSNFGTVGGMWATPIINYPEVCILGMARAVEQPVVRKGEIVIRPMMNLSWCCDHRVIDGDQTASFSNYFIHLVQHPAEIL
ncbi:MAG: dihydrolipoamide acetyltransferase [Waddliaceae bacterium]|nr:dihydrolipoamide acetyltransferase [Waddliaceae bacterium]